MVWAVCSKVYHHRKALTSDEIMSLDYSGELYSSLYYYDEYLYEYLEAHEGSLEGFDGKTHGHYFVIDLDGENRLPQVSAAAVELMKRLDHLDVKYYAFFSGGKGYHFYIPKEYAAYSEEYDGQWHRACRQFARQIIEETPELQPWVDFKIYDSVRIFRFPFSKYPKPRNGKDTRKTLVQYDPRGKYGIGVRGCDRLEVLRDIFYGSEDVRIAAACEEIVPFITLEDPKPERASDAPPAIETVAVGDLKIPEDEKVCIYRMMHDHECQGSRHNISLILMAYWREKMLSPQYIAANLHAWNRGLKKPLSDKDIETTLRYRDKYAYTCDDPLKQRYCSKECRFSKNKEKQAKQEESTDAAAYDLATQIRDWVTASEGVFKINDVYSAFMLNTRLERKNCSLVLTRLVQEGVIVRHGNSKGSFRVVSNDCPEMDWKGADMNSLPIKWPFAIERLVDAMPGNIIVIAGEPNSGKTAFLLNVARMNMHDFDVHYFNSEMGEAEWKKRLSLFEGMTLDDWKIHPYERNHRTSGKDGPPPVGIRSQNGEVQARS